MRRALAVIFALILLTGTARASETLEGDIATATGINRPISASLQAIAQVRAAQAVTDFSHDRKPPNTAEILAWNEGYSDPIQTAVNSWVASPEHHAIIFSTYWNVIGCGSVTVNGKFVAACELIHAAGVPPPRAPSPSAAPASPTPLRTPAVLPNTAYRRPNG